jgi:mercuric ion transport protein
LSRTRSRYEFADIRILDEASRSDPASEVRCSPPCAVSALLRLLAIVSSIGLGFLINDAILIPLLIAFLLITLVGLYLGIRHHLRAWALVLGAVGAVLLLLSVTFVGSGLLAGIGIAALVVASLLNAWLRMRQLRSLGRA